MPLRFRGWQHDRAEREGSQAPFFARRSGRGGAGRGVGGNAEPHGATGAAEGAAWPEVGRFAAREGGRSCWEKNAETWPNAEATVSASRHGLAIRHEKICFVGGAPPRTPPRRGVRGRDARAPGRDVRRRAFKTNPPSPAARGRKDGEANRSAAPAALRALCVPFPAAAGAARGVP